MRAGADDASPAPAAEPEEGPWTRAQVLALAGDDAVRRAAAAAAGGSWLEEGRRGRLLWGRCRGSGRTPYQVVVEPAARAFSCSCPSRKSPCKHALALLLRWGGGLLPEGAPPAFVEQRRGGGEQVLEPASVRPAGTLADPAAAAARAATRQQRVADGLEELSTWIGDQLRGGLAGLERRGYAAVEGVAARMVDAQAPGVAGILRALPAELGREGWPERVLEHLGALHLLVEAHRDLGRLPPALAATVRSRVGYPVTRAEVLAGPGIEDEWWAVGQLDSVEQRLESRRVWLWGRYSRRWALHLTFTVPGQTADTTVTAGERIQGALHFYPGSGQYRAVVGEHRRDPGAPEVPGGTATSGAELPPVESLPAARERFAALLAADPWAARMPAVLAVAPVPPRQDGPWRLRDADGWCRDVVGGLEPWPLLAASRGATVPVVVEWSAAGVVPLAVLDAGGGPVREAA